MATRTGNAFLGYTGKSDYTPGMWDPTTGTWSGKPYQISPSDYTFNQNQQFGHQGIGLGNTMYNAAMGQGPGVAQNQLYQQGGNAVGALYNNPSLSPYLAARAQNNMAMGMNQTGQQAQTAEEEMNRQLLSQYLLSQLQQRGQAGQFNVNSGNFNSQLRMQQDIANAQRMTKPGIGAAVTGAVASAIGKAASMGG